MEADLTLWLHLLAFAVYTGATVALVGICLPALGGETDETRRARLAAAMLRVYDPLSLAALGVSVMTGAFALTGYKASLRGRFFDQVGGPLAWKLFLTFLLVMVGAYIAFGLGHRLVRTVEAGEAIDAARLTAWLARLRMAAVLALVLVFAIAWVALRMTPALLPQSAQV